MITLTLIFVFCTISASNQEDKYRAPLPVARPVQAQKASLSYECYQWSNKYHNNTNDNDDNYNDNDETHRQFPVCPLLM